MTIYPQQPPYSLQVELAEGCNLACWFCGLQGITQGQGKYKLLTVPNATLLAARLGEATLTHNWNPRVEFAMHGEPTMNPDWVEIIRQFRLFNPNLQLMMTSNGGGLLRKPGITANVDAAFEAGLNILALDDYEGVMICDKVRHQYTGAMQMYEYPRDPAGNPHRRHKRGTQFITLLRDISVATKGTHSSLNNHAGSAFPKNQRAAGKRCAKPFREMSIRWDGNVAICCNDWPGEFKVGSALGHSLQTLWHHPALDAARRHLIRGQRVFGPCQGCDATSYRPGLLPDTRGQDTLPPPDDLSAGHIAAALDGEPYTPVVMRPWERDGNPDNWTEAAQRARMEGGDDERQAG